MLEEIGFIWNPIEEIFEKGFQETVKYKEQFGDPNAPSEYKTPQGFKLGSWQHRQRQSYKKDKLTSERIKRLDEIGFLLDRNFHNEIFEKGFKEIQIASRLKNGAAPSTPKISVMLSY